MANAEHAHSARAQTTPMGLAVGYQFSALSLASTTFEGDSDSMGFRARGSELGLAPALWQSASFAMNVHVLSFVGLLLRGSIGWTFATSAVDARIAPYMPTPDFAWSARGGPEFLFRVGPLHLTAAALLGAMGTDVRIRGILPASPLGCASPVGCARGTKIPTATAITLSGELTVGAAWVVRVERGLTLLPGLSSSLLVSPGVGVQALVTIGVWMGEDVR